MIRIGNLTYPVDPNSVICDDYTYVLCRRFHGITIQMLCSIYGAKRSDRIYKWKQRKKTAMDKLHLLHPKTHNKH